MTIYPDELLTFAARLPVPLYAVGGCVRDALLKRKSHDIDLCSALRPEQIRAEAAAAGIPCPTVNERLGTVLLCFGERRMEHTTFRTESYPSGGAHRPASIAFTDELEQDAFRRDFSINAVYQNVLTGAYVDPTGGIRDLKACVLRTTTDDPFEILRDDGLRILRLARFAADTGFSIDKRTMLCAQQNVALLADVAWERKRQELDRMLVLDNVLAALTTLYDLGALFALIPELKEADGLAQRREYHRYDVLTHLFHTCAHMPPTVELRLMGLLHDVGKPLCHRETGNFHRHAQYSESMIRTILRRLVYPNAIISRVSAAAKRHMFDLDERAKESTIRKKFVLWGQQGVADWIALREGDIRGSGYLTEFTADRWRNVYAAMCSEGCPWTESELNVTGRELMDALGLAPGPEVSRLKAQLLLHCACRPRDNQSARLLRLARDFATKVRKNC